MKNFYPLRLLALGMLIAFLTLFNGCNDTIVTPDEPQVVKGVLKDNYNQPIPNAVMEIISTSSAKTGLLADEILERDTTDEDGNFAFSKVPSDLSNIDLRIHHPDLMPYQEKLNTLLTPGSTNTSVQIQAQYQDSCCGRILIKVYNAQDSTILTGVEVRLNFADNLKRKGYTNDAGHINFYEVCMGSYWIRLAKYGFNVLEQENITVVGCDSSNFVELSIYMTPFERDSCCNGVFTVEPVDANTNTILNGATVKLRKDGIELARKVIEGQPAIFRELCRGEYQYVILRDGYKPIETTITFGCNDSINISPQMEEIPCCDGVLTVKVLDTLNNPIREATVKIYKNGTKLGYYYTNSDGIVKFTGLCEGEYALDIVRTGYKSIEFKQAIGCDDTVEITKNLASSQDTCCNNTVKVFAKDNRTNEALNGATVKMFQNGSLLRTETVIEGAAIFREVCKGTYSFLIKKDGYDAVDFSVTVECGETKEIEKALNNQQQQDSCCNGVAKVVVRDADGNLLQYSIVRLWKGSTKIRESKTGDNGTVEMKELCEGNYAFSINREGYKETEWAFEMGCNDTVEFEKTLTAVPVDTCCRAQIKLDIKDENGNPVSLVWTKLTKSGTVVREGKTNEDGKLNLVELCTGTYWLRIAKDGYKVQEIEINVECNKVYELSKTLVKSTDTCCTAVMKIRALDSTETWINEAKVEVYKNDTKIADGYTNSEGWWAEDGLCAPATYRVVVSKDGFITSEFYIKYEYCTTIQKAAILKRN